MEQKQYYKEELYSTSRKELVSGEILDKWKKEWEDVQKELPSKNRQQYMMILSLWGRFARLSDEKLAQDGFKEILESIRKEVASLSDAQVVEAIGIFDVDDWQKRLKKVSIPLDDDRETDDSIFEECVALASELDDFGSALVVATKRGLNSIESLEWGNFVNCSVLLGRSEMVRQELSTWIQSMAVLIDEQINERDYELAYAAELWSELLEWLVTDQRVYEGHSEYIEFMKDEFCRMLEEFKIESPQATLRARNTLDGSPLGEFVKNRQPIMAAAMAPTHRAPFDKWYSPDGKWQAYGLLEKQEAEKLCYVVSISPVSETKSESKNWSGGHVRLLGVTCELNASGEAVFNMSEIQQQIENGEGANGITLFVTDESETLQEGKWTAWN